MTDKELANRLLLNEMRFAKMCAERDCKGCEMEAFADSGVCLSAWIFKRMKKSLEKEAATAPKESPKAKEEAKLPAWAKVGQWGLMNNKLYKIVEVDGGDLNPLTVKDIHGDYAFAHPRVMCPVKFRAYTYEEAKGQIGKMMEYTFSTGSGYAFGAILISRVTCRDDGESFIHSCSFDDWVSYNATINGVPIGVPEVDEEAMKGDGKGEKSMPHSTCKHRRWFGEYGMHVCEKRGRFCSEEVYEECVTKGGAE